MWQDGIRLGEETVRERQDYGTNLRCARPDKIKVLLTCKQISFIIKLSGKIRKYQIHPLFAFISHGNIS